MICCVSKVSDGHGVFCVTITNLCCTNVVVFFFKQKTAYEIGTGDWSSDVCSSDLEILHQGGPMA